MARKVPTERYTPASVPSVEGLPQFLYDELWRIATAIEPFPITLNIKMLGMLVGIGPTPTSSRLFLGIDPLQENPGGQWDSALAEWVCDVTGVYQMSVNLLIEPFGAGNKDYLAQVFIYTEEDGLPREIWHSTDTGIDNMELGVAISLAGPLTKGDKLWAEAVLMHELFTGNVTVNAYMSLVQVGEAG